MNRGANLSPVRKPQAAAPRLYVPQALPEGGECRATIIRMGRSSVQARIGAHAAIEREAARMPPESTRTGTPWPWPRWRCWRESLSRVCP